MSYKPSYMMPVITLKIITSETKLEKQHLDNGNATQFNIGE